MWSSVGKLRSLSACLETRPRGMIGISRLVRLLNSWVAVISTLDDLGIRLAFCNFLNLVGNISLGGGDSCSGGGDGCLSEITCLSPFSDSWEHVAKLGVAFSD